MKTRIGLTPLILLLTTVTIASASERPGLMCAGQAPQHWSLAIGAASALFTAPQQNSIDYELKHVTRSSGRDWPQALTLLAAADTAIVLLDQKQCADRDDWTVNILTQRSREPVLLSGCCRPLP